MERKDFRLINFSFILSAGDSVVGFVRKLVGGFHLQHCPVVEWRSIGYQGCKRLRIGKLNLDLHISSLVDYLNQPIVLFSVWIVRKILFREPYVNLNDDSSALFDTLEALYYTKPPRPRRSRMLQRLSLKSLLQQLRLQRRIASQGQISEMTGDSPRERNSHPGAARVQSSTSGSSTIGGQNPSTMVENRLGSMVSERL